MTYGTDEDLSVLFVAPPDAEPSLSGADLTYASDEGYGTILENGDLKAGIYEIVPDPEHYGISDLGIHELTLQQAYLVEDPSHEESATERLHRLLELVEDVYFAVDDGPAFVFGVPFHFAQTIREANHAPVDAETLANDEVNYTLWLNVFSPPLVETYGRERLLDAPVWHVEEWDDGSILVVTDEQPLQPTAHRDLNEHLGLEDPGI